MSVSYRKSFEKNENDRRKKKGGRRAELVLFKYSSEDYRKGERTREANLNDQLWNSISLRTENFRWAKKRLKRYFGALKFPLSLS